MKKKPSWGYLDLRLGYSKEKEHLPLFSSFFCGPFFPVCVCVPMCVCVCKGCCAWQCCCCCKYRWYKESTGKTARVCVPADVFFFFFACIETAGAVAFVCAWSTYTYTASLPVLYVCVFANFCINKFKMLLLARFLSPCLSLARSLLGALSSFLFAYSMCVWVCIILL